MKWNELADRWHPRCFECGRRKRHPGTIREACGNEDCGRFEMTCSELVLLVDDDEDEGEAK